jgi:hypothetical protein
MSHTNKAKSEDPAMGASADNGDGEKLEAILEQIETEEGDGDSNGDGDTERRSAKSEDANADLAELLRS